MRKLYVLFLMMCAVALNAQPVSSYVFTSSSGTYVPLTGGIASTANGDDTYEDGLPIGFSFIYGGTGYTFFSVTPNGFIKLGTSSAVAITAGVPNYTNELSTTATNRPLIAPLWDDNNLTGGAVTYLTTGASPNRKLTVQWQDLHIGGGGSASNPTASFQIVLNEGTNSIQFNYGTINAFSTVTASIGLNDNTSFLSVTPGSPAIASPTTANNSISSSTNLTSGTIYNFALPAGCTGTPLGGTITPATASICGGTIALNIAGATVASGLTYQWQSSTDNSTWSNITGATAVDYTATGVNATTYFRRVTTCTSSNISSNSTVATVTVNAATFAPLPVIESFENTWINGCNTKDVPNNSWRNTPATGNNSWRRNDDGVASAGWSSNNGTYTPAASQGTYSARFHSYDASSGTTGAFDLYVNCNTAAATKRLLFDFINTSGTDTLTVLLSTDGGTTFVRLDSARTSTTWRTKTLYFNSTSANTILRFRATSDFGVTDIGLDNINLSDFNNCTGTPVAGTTVSTVTNITCYNAPFTLSLTGTTLAGGLAYQWQYSDDNVTWVSVTGATNATFTTSQTQTSRYYRAIVICTTSGQSSNSPSLQVTSVGGPSYTTLPFQEQFETPWVNVCSTRDVPSLFWSNSPSTGNNSWRRDDDGTAAAWTSPTLGAYTPTGAQNTPHSARFHSYSSGTTINGDLNIYINANTAVANKRLVFDYINTSGTDSLAVYISTDGGTTFTLYKSLRIATEWTNQIVDFTTTSATTVIRFRALGGGTTDIGIDEINIFNLLNCTGTPTAGTIATSATSVCIGNTVNLTNTGATYGQAGITYQWQQSTNGGTTWTSITGANGLFYNFTVASGFVTTSYRFQVTCSFSNTTVTSNVVQVVLPAPTYVVLPYTESFESAWINSCNTRDIPNNSWRNTPFTGNNSWRRDDDGDAAGWVNVTLGTYTPTASVGNRSARFHSYQATGGTAGNFDLYVNANTGIPVKRLMFDYINTSGNDSLVVSFSTDNGVTFTRLDSVRTSTIWKTKTIVFTSASPTTIIRFRAVSDFGTTDIGLDNINLVSFPDCTGTPAGGTASASQASACISSVIRLSLTGQTVNQNGLTYKWQQSADGTTNWTDIPGASTSSYDYTVPSGFTTMFFRGVTTCTPSNSSANSTVIQLSVPAPTYSSLPMTQTFDSTWSSVCSTRDVPAATGWRNAPFIGNMAWRREDDTTGGNWANMLGTPSTTGAMSTTHYARIHTYSVTAPNNGNLDVYINASSGPADKEVSFYYINPAGSDSLRVMLSTNGGTTFTPIGFQYANNTDWDQKVIAFTSSSPTTVIRFSAYAGSITGTADIGIDQVNIKSVDCAQPPNITANITSPTTTQSIAVLKWRPVVNALAYEIAYSTSPIPPSYGDITGDTTYTFSNLVPVTQYYIFVRTLCFNGGYSSWYVYGFTTPCPSQTVPYFEGFESITTNNTLPSCMASSALGDFNYVSTYTAIPAAPTYNRGPLSGNKFAAFRYSTNTATNGSWIFTQPILVNAGTNYDASFWYRTDGATGWQIIGLYWGTSQDPAAMIKLDSVTNRTNTEYLQLLKSVQFPTTGNIYLGIRVVATFAPNYLSVDNIELKLGAVVPVTFLKFTGEARGDYNHLNWSTATEINNKGFEIERSEDGTKFNTIGFVNTLAPNGNSNSQLDYTFDDKAPLQGVNYYRLKQIDRDGKISYSSIVAVKSNRVYELKLASVYPNPTTSVLNVKVVSPLRSKVQLIITDIAGKQVYQSSEQLQQGETSLRINVAGFSTGSYVVKLICADGCNATPVKFIKQ